MYCQHTDLTDYVLDAYLVAAEKQSAGIVSKTLSNVSGEIDDALRARFVLPLTTVPTTLKRIAAVISSYRIVGSITSIVSSEGGSNNEWIPLQTQYKQAVRDLESIRSGNLDIGLDELGEESLSDSSVAVVAPRPVINLKGWR